MEFIKRLLFDLLMLSLILLIVYFMAPAIIIALYQLISELFGKLITFLL